MLKGKNADVNIVDRVSHSLPFDISLFLTYNITFQEGSTALHRATSHGNVEVTKFVLTECSADVSIKNKVSISLLRSNNSLFSIYLQRNHTAADEATTEEVKALFA